MSRRSLPTGGYNPRRTFIAYLACACCGHWWPLCEVMLRELIAPHWFICPFCAQGRKKVCEGWDGVTRRLPVPDRLDIRVELEPEASVLPLVACEKCGVGAPSAVVDDAKAAGWRFAPGDELVGYCPDCGPDIPEVTAPMGTPAFKAQMEAVHAAAILQPQPKLRGVLVAAAKAREVEPEPLPLPTDEKEFWTVWARLSGVGWRERLTPAELELRARMAVLVDERLGVGRRR